MRHLGLDLGSRRLGIALSDKGGIVAANYKVIHHNEEYERLVDEIVSIVREEHVDKIVLGFPKNMNNTIGPKGELSIDFKKMLEERVDIPIVLQDERLTTKSALDVLIKGGVSRKKRKDVVDSLAATIILQTYLDRGDKDEEE